jgi:hypothetical protein
VLQTSTNNDFLFSQEGQNIVIYDLNANPTNLGSIKVESGCVATRARENEA